jgi:tRNA pseudouridine55 synthase
MEGRGALCGTCTTSIRPSSHHYIPISSGVGSGTKELQHYLSGAKRYAAGLTFGYETNTLDAEGNVTQTAPFDHITLDAVQQILPDFTGQISQIPPIFSKL